jgi:hypothetical protein
MERRWARGGEFQENSCPSTEPNETNHRAEDIRERGDSEAWACRAACGGSRDGGG